MTLDVMLIIFLDLKSKSIINLPPGIEGKRAVECTDQIIHLYSDCPSSHLQLRTDYLVMRYVLSADDRSGVN